MSRTDEISKLKIRPEDRTPLVDQLLDIMSRQNQRIEALEAEIVRLKGLPDKPRYGQPSTLEDPEGKPSAAARKKKTKKKGIRGKRPGSAKRAKTAELVIHDTVPLEIPGLPHGTERLGFKDYYVQDLKIGAHNTCYRRARYRTPDGRLVIAPLPENIQGHFGSDLRSYLLYQHFHNQVTQPLLHEELTELGIDISSGEINRLLTEGHDVFHEEKDGLLPAARKVSDVLHTDDTGAKHCGKNGHTLHIGNQWFAAFFTTQSKSRVNFLEVLQQPWKDYWIGAEALEYMEHFRLPGYLVERIGKGLKSGERWLVEGRLAWDEQLEDWEITSPQHRRIVTEAALYGSLLEHELYDEMTLISDDAKQFKVLGFLNGLCWVHAERHVARLVPLNAKQRRAHEQVRDEIWTYYQQLKAYREHPTKREQRRLEREFDRLFQQPTEFAELNEVLRTLHGKKAHLLLVLEHPEIPLHNNLSENDIRQFVKKRKISAGTRSDLGRRCRDTFLSLKTTCRKLGVSFLKYLQDRINGLGEIAPLPQLIEERAAAS
jgi:hypothetical protein